MNDFSREISIAAPTIATQAAIWRLAHETDNSNAYLLWCTDYFDQSLIAWINGQLAGFVIAGELRSGSETARIVDIAVSASFPRHLVVPSLLDQLVTQLLGRGVCFIESSPKSTDSELCADLQALANRWASNVSIAETLNARGERITTFSVGPLRSSRPDREPTAAQ